MKSKKTRDGKIPQKFQTLVRLTDNELQTSGAYSAMRESWAKALQMLLNIAPPAYRETVVRRMASEEFATPDKYIEVIRMRIKEMFQERYLARKAEFKARKADDIFAEMLDDFDANILDPALEECMKATSVILFNARIDLAVTCAKTTPYSFEHRIIVNAFLPGAHVIFSSVDELEDKLRKIPADQIVLPVKVPTIKSKKDGRPTDGNVSKSGHKNSELIS